MIFLYMTKIINLENSYRKFTELLPEELLDPKSEEELRSNKSQLLKIIEEDLNFVKEKIGKSGKNLCIDRFEKAEYTISKVFLFPKEKEKLRSESDIINYFLGHWWICQFILKNLADIILEELPTAGNCFNDYCKLDSKQRRKRMAFIDLTRSYQRFIGSAVNILDILKEYVEYFNSSCKKIDPTFTYQGGRSVAQVNEFELLEGVSELLLRGNFGRFTPTPLIRSAIEVMIIRSVLSTEQSKKHNGKSIKEEPDFKLKDVLNAADSLGIQVSFGTDSIRRLYGLGSISVHKAQRVPHAEIWYALHFADNLKRGILIVQDKDKVSETLDLLLDELIDKNKISIE